jgi:hypothetical protein
VGQIALEPLLNLFIGVGSLIWHDGIL